MAVSVVRIALGVAALLAAPGICAGAEDNPPAAGFKLGASDPRAVAVADATMKAMGGRAAWDQTRYLTWKFFGTRLHVWDKWTGDARIEYDQRGTGQHVIILMNVNTRKGRAWQGGTEVTDGPRLAALLKDGLEAWINDSYWIAMPYKLKDSGVTLKYQGEAKMEDGRAAQVLTLTFEGVGVTPQNKYDVYVARDSGLVEQWAYYENAADKRPRFTTPWHEWRRYGKIMLSTDRGKGKGHTDVAVFGELPEAVFKSPQPVDFSGLGAGAKKGG